MEKTEFEIIIENAMNMEQGDSLEISSSTKSECNNIISYLKREKNKYVHEYGYAEAERIVIDKIQTNDKKHKIILTKETFLDACIIKNNGTTKKLDLKNNHDD